MCKVCKGARDGRPQGHQKGGQVTTRRRRKSCSPYEEVRPIRPLTNVRESILLYSPVEDCLNYNHRLFPRARSLLSGRGGNERRPSLKCLRGDSRQLCPDEHGQIAFRQLNK